MSDHLVIVIISCYTLHVKVMRTHTWCCSVATAIAFGKTRAVLCLNIEIISLNFIIN